MASKYLKENSQPRNFGKYFIMEKLSKDQVVLFKSEVTQDDFFMKILVFRFQSIQ